MAQQTTVRFIDDLDGSDAVGTVTFSLENRWYEIDRKYSEFPSVGGQRVTRRRRLTTVGR
jgi:hypothetical protein